MGFSAAVIISSAIAYDQGEKARKAQNRAQQFAEENARKQAAAADIATNKANQKRPNIAGILAAAQSGQGGGVSGTMLTGPQGVTGGMPLGGSTLLGS